MRKHLLWLSLLLLSAGIEVFQKPSGEIMHSGQPVSKSISIVVCADENYSAPVYNETIAQLHITAIKLRGNKRTIVWDTIYKAQKLQDYPSLKNTMSTKAVINNLLDSKEELEVSYILTYDSKGSRLQMYKSSIFTAGTQNEQVWINL